MFKWRSLRKVYLFFIKREGKIQINIYLHYSVPLHIHLYTNTWSTHPSVWKCLRSDMDCPDTDSYLKRNKKNDNIQFFIRDEGNIYARFIANCFSARYKERGIIKQWYKINRVLTKTKWLNYTYISFIPFLLLLWCLYEVPAFATDMMKTTWIKKN